MRDLDETKLAVLIDADNVSYTNIQAIMEEAAKYGVATIRRIYGDWTQPEKTRWKQLLLEHAITPIQQYSYTYGKNATDSTMIIDAMDLLYGGKVQGFCLISSDSDFTRLAIRLREAGMYVIGMGEQKTPKPFVVSCDKFIYVEIIKNQNAPKPANGRRTQTRRKPESVPEPAAVTPAVPVPAPEAIPTAAPEPVAAVSHTADTEESEFTFNEAAELIATAIADVADEDGWAFLGVVGSMATKRRPDFDPRLFGFSKLTQFMRACDYFEVEERATNMKRVKHIYVRDKRNLV